MTRHHYVVRSCPLNTTETAVLPPACDPPEEGYVWCGAWEAREMNTVIDPLGQSADQVTILWHNIYRRDS